MRMRYRKTLSVLCALCMLLISMPFRAQTENIATPTDLQPAAQDTAVAVPANAEPENPVPENPESLDPENPDPESPVPENPDPENPVPEYTDPAPADARNEPGTGDAEQEQKQEEPPQADREIDLSAEAGRGSWSVSASLNAEKPEYTIRVTARQDCELYFVLESVYPAQASVSAEDGGNRASLEQDPEQPEDSGTLRRILKKYRVQAGKNALIRVTGQAGTSFALRIMTPDGWEDWLEEQAEKPEDAPEQKSEEDTAVPEQKPEEDTAVPENANAPEGGGTRSAAKNLRGSGLRGENISSDLSGFLSTVALKYDGTAVSGPLYALMPGSEYTLELTFREGTGHQFDNTQLTGLELPDIFTGGYASGTFDVSVQAMLDGEDHLITETLTGNMYTVDSETRVLTVNWNTKGGTAYQRLIAGGNVVFQLSFAGTYNGKTVNWAVLDSAGIRFYADLTAALTVEKERMAINKVRFNRTTKKYEIDYTIAVTSSGQTKDIDIVDTVTDLKREADPSLPAGMVIDASSVKVYKVSGETKTLLTAGTDYTVPEAADSQLKVHYPGLLNNGEKVLVEYTCQVEGSRLTQSGSYLGTSSDGISNTAVVNGKNGSGTAIPYNPDTMSDEDKLVDAIPGAVLTKSGWLESSVKNEDGSYTVRVGWAVKGTNVFQLAGRTIRDKLGYDEQHKMHVAGDGFSISIPNSPALFIRWENVTLLDREGHQVTNPADAYGWEYTLTEADETAIRAGQTQPALIYTINYVADLTVSADEVYSFVVKNQAWDSTGGGIFTPHKENGVDYATLRIVPEGENALKLTKQLVSYDAETRVAEWKIILRVPKEGVTGRAVRILDELPRRKILDTMYFDTLTDTANPANSVSVQGLREGETYELTAELAPATNTPNVKVLFKYTDPVSGETKSGFLPSETGSAREITVTLKTVCDEDWLEISEAPGLPDRDSARHHNNIARYAEDGSNNLLNVSATLNMPGSPRVKKNEYNHETAGTRMTEGAHAGEYRYVFTYTLDVYGLTGTVPFTFTDTFDEKLEWLDGTAQWGYPAGVTVRRVENSETESKDVVSLVQGADYTVRGNVFTLLSTDKFKLEQNQFFYPHYRIVYHLALYCDQATLEEYAAVNGDADGVVRLGNSVVSTLGTDSVETPVTYAKIGKELLNEAEVQSGAGDPKFSIEINPYAVQMGSGSTVTMTDTMSANLSILPDTVSIQVYGPDGAVDSGADVAWNVTSDTASGKHVLTVTVPNGRRALITYAARVNGNTSKVEFENTATLLGQTSTVENWSDKSSAGSGTSSAYLINILKVEGQNMNLPVPGVKFVLKEKNGDAWINPGGVAAEVYFETNQYGYAQVYGDMSRDGWTLAKGKQYCLKETDVPDGFRLKETEYLFTIADQADYPDFIYFNQDTMVIRNVRKHGELTVSKTLSGELRFGDLSAADMAKIGFTVTKPDGTAARDADGLVIQPFTLRDIYDAETGKAEKTLALPVGTYTVTETDGLSGQTITLQKQTAEFTAGEGSAGGSAVSGTPEKTCAWSVTIGADGDRAALAFDNAYRPADGSLKLKKEVTVNGAAPETDAEKALVAGDYVFTIESTTLSPKVTRTVTVHFGETGAATAVTPGTDGETVTLKDGTVTVGGLRADTYTITERAPANGTVLVNAAVSPDTAESGNSVNAETHAAAVKVTAGDTAEVPTAAFTNNRESYQLCVTKAVTGASAPSDGEYTVTVTSGTAMHIDPETAVSGQKSGTVPELSEDRLTLSFTMTAGSSVTVTGLSSGTYTVREADGDYTAAYTKWLGDTKPAEPETGSEVALSSTNPKGTVEVLNTYPDKGCLKVQKTIRVNGTAPTDDNKHLMTGTYTFRVYKANEAGNGRAGDTAVDTIGITFDDTDTAYVKTALSKELEAGKYWVEEDPAEKLVGTNGQCVTVTAGVSAEADIPAAGTAAFVNNADVGCLQITKNVTGTDDRTKEFTFEVVLAAPAGVPLASGYPAEKIAGTTGTEMTVDVDADGKVITEIKLKADESLLMKELPAGTVCTVTETNIPAGYEQTGKDDDLTREIETDNTAEITVENTYSAKGSASPSAFKVLEGRDLKENEFSFVLKDADGEVIETVKNAADGSVAFSAIEYTLEDMENSPIRYTISEVKGDDPGVDYDATVIPLEVTLADNGDGTITATINRTGKDATFTNKCVVYTSASVRKVWKDDNNRDGKRPVSLSVKLLADGEEIAAGKLTAENNWTWTEKDLRKVDPDGREIVYTWSEATPDGYEPEGIKTDGTLTTLTNVYTPETTSVSVKKVWDDNGNAAGKRPAGIRVQLYADGTAEGDLITLNAANGWSWTWTDLNKYVNRTGAAGGSEEIVYTVEEIEIPEGYKATVTGSAAKGFVITNAFGTGKLVIEKKIDVAPKEEKPEELQTLVDIPVVKIWDDNDNRDLNRPASVTVRLYAGGEEIGSAALNEANGWQYTFRDLPKYRNNKTIRYTVQEDPVEMYAAEYQGYTIVNRYMPELTSVSVRKVWDDNDSNMMLRPKSVRMTLSNGTSVLLSGENGWTATVSNLPAVVNGETVEYTWTEQEVPGYRQTDVTTNGTLTTFTNRVIGVPKVPADRSQPRVPGETWFIFEEYDTALGIPILINHVGDCFD